MECLLFSMFLVYKHSFILTPPTTQVYFIKVDFVKKHTQVYINLSASGFKKSEKQILQEYLEIIDEIDGFQEKYSLCSRRKKLHLASKIP